MKVAEIMSIVMICEHHIITLDEQIRDEEDQRIYYAEKMSGSEEPYYAEAMNTALERIRSLKSEKDAALICIGKLKNLEVQL